MNIRKIVSLVLLLSLALCILTSIILFITPHGRVAYWSDWTLWGLNKSQWSELHVNLGILFLLAGLLHTGYNWKAITGYLKNRAQKMKFFTPEFNIALVMVLFVGLGTYFRFPPMSTITNFGESIKETAGIKYGEPPYGHAELSSLKMFARKTGLDLSRCRQLLQKADIIVENDQQTIKEIAHRNHLTPKKLFAIIKPAGPGTSKNFPDAPFPGFGRKKLAQQGIKATPAQTIKEIATSDQLQPMAMFEILKKTAR